MHLLGESAPTCPAVLVWHLECLAAVGHLGGVVAVEAPLSIAEGHQMFQILRRH